MSYLTLVLSCIFGAGHAAAQTEGIAFTGLDSLRIWPGQTITVRIDGEPHGGVCVLTNLITGDVASRGFSIDDSVAFITLPFGAGWMVGPPVAGDTVLQVDYGHLVMASVPGLADTARIGVEAARFLIDPEEAVVGGMISVWLHDRDHDRDISKPDTVAVMWSSALANESGQVILGESGPSTGRFSAHVAVSSALEPAPPPDALIVIDADTLTFSLWDSLAGSEGWNPPYGLEITQTAKVLTHTAEVSVTHPLYGAIAFFPLDGDSLQVAVHEPDLAGAASVPVGVAIVTPEGSLRDSAEVVLHQVAAGMFSAAILLGGPGAGLVAMSGDSLLVFYQDRADESGVSRVLQASASLGAVVVSGIVADSVWLPEAPRLLVDTVTVAAGRVLRVAPGSVVAAIPGQSVTWYIEGTLELGAAGGDTAWVRSAAATRGRGDWSGIRVAGSLLAYRAHIADGHTGVAVLPGASASLSSVRLDNCGAAMGEDLTVWREARRGRDAVAGLARQARFIPGALSSTEGFLVIEQSIVEHNGGYGICADGGECELENSTLRANSLDGLLAIGSVCRINETCILDNEEGGIYAIACSLAAAGTSLRSNALQGIYVVGGSVDLENSELLTNAGGGIMIRDGARAAVRGSLIAQNHGFGIDEAWDCRLEMDFSTVAGNGGDGVTLDYASEFNISASTLAFNRGYSVHVGPWCPGELLDSRDCWWGTTNPPLDSTGVNNGLIFDGIDSPGRAIVLFSPWRTSPPAEPAPGELVPVGGEMLSFIEGGGGPGDTLTLELVSPGGQMPARYAAAAVASSLDTLVCVLLTDSPSGVGPLRVRIALTNTADTSAPDRLASALGDRIVAWWVADSTVTADLTLPAGPSGVIPREIVLEAYPNPFSTSLVLTWRAPGPGVELALLDMAGRRVWHRSNLEEAGQLILDGPHAHALPQGAYAAVVRFAHRGRCVRVIRIR